jgi:signal transduction histidine kinase
MNKLADVIESKINELNDQNKQLQQDLIDKKNSEMLRKELISNISHELKTPLTLIMGYAEALKTNLKTESKDKYCETILNESNRMNSLITGLLDIAKLQSNNTSITYEKFDLDLVLKDLLSKYAILFKENDIDIEYHSKSDMVVFADKVKIETALDNFISNAIRYTSGENKKIVVNLKYVDNNRVSFSIYNTCNPFTDEQKVHIWDSFYRIDKSRSRKIEGTGLGLYLVKTIMELHNFDYGVNNKTDGVEFYFETK